MTPDLRERLSRLLCEAAGTDPDSTSADPSVASPAWRWHEGTADAALRLIAEAQRESPDEVVAKAIKHRGPPGMALVARGIWETVRDAWWREQGVSDV